MPNIYFLVMHDPADINRDFGLVKVGITDGEVADRIAQLQTGNPYELRCVDIVETSCALEVERFVHRIHATEMQHLEWLRRSRVDIPRLADQVRQAARRIEERQGKIRGIAAHPSNGVERRAVPEEIALHRDARSLKRELVRAELTMEAAGSMLKAATGATLGIPGVVRVTRVEDTSRFSARIAEAKFPGLVERSRINDVSGTFRWRRVPKPMDFVTERQTAAMASAAAKTAADRVLAARVSLDGWTHRTGELEQHHDEFLRATQAVNRLEGDLADVQNELIVRLGDHDGLVGVCSFIRRPIQRIDVDLFCGTFPLEASECHEPVALQLRKYVYPSRPYW